MLKELRKIKVTEKIKKDYKEDEYGRGTYSYEYVTKILYFHKWIVESGITYGDTGEFQFTKNYALVENEEGKILKMDPEEIRFVSEKTNHEYLK